MADVASKQQTTALVLSTIVTRLKRHTELKKIKLTNLMRNLCCAREQSVPFFVQFFYTVKMRSGWIWGPLRTCDNINTHGSLANCKIKYAELQANSIQLERIFLASINIRTFNWRLFRPTVFRNVALCISGLTCQSFGRTRCLHLQVRRMKKTEAAHFSKMLASTKCTASRTRAVSSLTKPSEPHIPWIFLLEIRPTARFRSI